MKSWEKLWYCEKIVDEIQQKSRRPVCRLHFAQQPFSITDSHLGGVPYLPHGLLGETPEQRQKQAKILKRIEIGGCKVGGYPRYWQDDPRLYGAECGRPLEEWDTLLFQLDDDTFTFPAGDVGEMGFELNGGTLNFVIRAEDLAKRDFSQVLAQWACT